MCDTNFTSTVCGTNFTTIILCTCIRSEKPGCYVRSMRCVMGARCIDSSRLGHRTCFHSANHPRLSILSPGVRGSKLVVSVQVFYTLSLHNNMYTNHYRNDIEIIIISETYTQQVDIYIAQKLFCPKCGPAVLYTTR